MEPECTKSGAKIEKNALNRPKRLPDGSQDPFTQKVSQIFSNFWVPSGIPKSTKNRSLAPKGAPGSDFCYRIFSRKALFSLLGLIFYRFLVKHCQESQYLLINIKYMPNNIFLYSIYYTYSLTSNCPINYDCIRSSCILSSDMPCLCSTGDEQISMSLSA